MSNVAMHQTHPSTYVVAHEDEREVTGWTGWVMFGGVMMALMGMFQAVAGLVGLFRSSWYVVSTNQLLIFSTVRQWGWANLIIGSIVLLAGLALMTGATWARVLAVFIAGLAALANVVAIALYPFWALIGLTLAVLVIYAVIVHGGELKQTD